MLTEFDTPQTAGAAHEALLKRYVDGTLSAEDQLYALMPPLPDCCTLLVAVHRAHYSASLMARAVEDADVPLLSLAVTAMQLPADDPRLVVALRVGCRTTSAVEASLARYDMEVIHSSAPISEARQSQAQARIQELLHYLDI